MTQAESRFFALPAVGDTPAHRLHTLVWPAQQQLHPPLICVHGLTRVAGDFSVLAAQLSATRDVYSFDMPGRGQSEWLANPADYSYQTYVRDCLTALAQLDAPQVDWLGTSMGGLIGMMIAALPAHRLRRLVLNDVGPFIPLGALQRIGTHVSQTPFFADLRQAEIYCLKSYASFGITGAENWQRFTKDSVRAAEGGYQLHYDPKIAEIFASVKADVDLWALYDTLKLPTLLLRGELSDTLLADTAQQMTQRGPHAKLVTFAGCGHTPALVDAVQVEAVRSFLDE